MLNLRRLAGYARTVLLDPWSSGSLVWVTVGVFLAIGAFRYTALTAPNHDVAWLLLAAERLLDGGTYLENFYEVNWPLAIMIYCPGVWLSDLFGIDLYAGFLIYFFVLIGGSVVATRKVLHRVLPDFPAVRGFLTVAYAWLLFFPHHLFGQREHIALALFLPFVIVASSRAAGRLADSRSAEICFSAAAAIGILIKPHFILIPGAIFLVRLLRAQSLRVFWHPDVLTFLVFGCSYIAVLVLIYPGWIEVAQFALQLYSAYDADPGALLRTAGSATGLAALVGIACRFSTLPDSAKSLIFHLALTVVIATAIYVVQRKGWSYQFLPAKITLVLLILAFAGLHIARVEPSHPLRRPLHGVLVAMFLASIAMLPVARDIWRDYHRLMRYHSAPLTLAVRAVRSSDSLFVFSADVRDGFPMVLLENRVWASRFSALWPALGIVTQLSEARTAAQKERLFLLRRSMIEMTVADFRRYFPGIVLVPNDAYRSKHKYARELLSFFLADPAFEAIWRRYRPAGSFGRFDLYVRFGTDDSEPSR